MRCVVIVWCLVNKRDNFVLRTEQLLATSLHEEVHPLATAK